MSNLEKQLKLSQIRSLTLQADRSLSLSQIKQRNYKERANR